MIDAIGHAKYKRLFKTLFTRRKPLTRASEKWTEHVVMPLWSVRVLERYASAPHAESIPEIDAAKLASDLESMGTPDQATALVLKIVHELQGDLSRAKALLEEEQVNGEAWHERYLKMVVK